MFEKEEFSTWFKETFHKEDCLNNAVFTRQSLMDAAEFGYNKANEWHYVKDGDLPKENQECYFIYSNTYDKHNKVSFAKSNINVRTGIYSFFLDDEGNQTTEPCFYDDVIGDEWDLSEVYAWKEIVLPELKDGE